MNAVERKGIDRQGNTRAHKHGAEGKETPTLPLWQGGCRLLCGVQPLSPRYAGKIVSTARPNHWIAVTPATRGNDRR